MIPTSYKKKFAILKQDSSDVIRSFFNVGTVKQVFRVGSDFIAATQPFFEARTPLNAARAFLHVGKIVVDNLEMWPDDFFDDSWAAPYPEDFSKLIISALEDKPYKTLKTSDESQVLKIITFGDVRFGYVHNSKTDLVDRIYVESKKMDEGRRLIKEELWRRMKDDNIVLRHTRRRRVDDSDVALTVDDAFRPMPSSRAKQCADHIRRCIDAGVNRSVMLYGPPGTGKSTMARTIVDHLKLRSFRIRVEDIGNIDSNTVFESIGIFEPDAVILDDFDRCHDQTSLLETLEYFQRHVKLVVATVNDRRRLDSALLRPGRFDEIISVKKMDLDVVKAVLGDEHVEALEVVKDWPIAYVQEYVKRRRFMSPEEAQESIFELAERVKAAEDGGDEDSITDKVLATRKLHQSDKASKDIIKGLLKDARRRR